MLPKRIQITTLKKRRWIIVFSSACMILTCFMVILQVNYEPSNKFNLLNISIEFLNLPSSSCTLEDTFIILVHTSPDNSNRRKTIRSTWKKDADENNIKVFFNIGTTTIRKAQEDLKNEIFLYHDFIQGSFEDTYHNLTYKHIMNFKYVLSYCPRIKYLLKIDDDVFVNIATVTKFLDFYIWQYGSSNNIICQRLRGNPVLREGKWKVSTEEYPNSTYPTYCSGFAVIYPIETIALLDSVTDKRKYFWIDDVFVTGMLAEAAGIQHTDLVQLIWSENKQTPFLFGTYNMNDRH